MNNLKKFIKTNLQWEDIIEVPSIYFIENSIIGKIFRKLTTIGNHTTHNGHGLHISCKIVLPTHCQADCAFCFNKITRETQMHDKDLFIQNLWSSLETIFKHIGRRKISFDITGNEPTFDLMLLDKVLLTLQHFKQNYPKSFAKVVITTNGYRLEELLDKDIDIIDYINLSMHDSRYEERVKIFQTKQIPTNTQIMSLNQEAHSKGIATTAVVVIHKPVEDFENLIKDFSYLSKYLGFDNVRVRIDYKGNEETRNQFFNNFKNEPIDICPGLMTKSIAFDGLENTNIYLGVKALTDYVIGSEVIIDDDGNLYMDYNKKFLIKDYDIIDDLLNKIYWNPEIWWDESLLRNTKIK